MKNGKKEVEQKREEQKKQKFPKIKKLSMDSPLHSQR